MTGLQRQLDRFQTYYNTVRPHRTLNRRTPTQAYAARPKAVPTGPIIPAHYRVRTDRIDNGGIGDRCATTAGCTTSAWAPGSPAPRCSLLIDNLHIRVIDRYTGELIRELTLDPDPRLPTPRT